MRHRDLFTLLRRSPGWAVFVLAIAGLIASTEPISARQKTQPAPAPTEQTDVYFAGIAYTGDASTASDAFPYSHRVLQVQDGALRINTLLRETLQQMPMRTLVLRFNDLANLDGSTSAIAMAVGIDRETVVVEEIGGRYKVLTEIAANALFFDFREKMVVASRPVTLQRIDVDDVRLSSIVEHLLTSSGNDALVANIA